MIILSEESPCKNLIILIYYSDYNSDLVAKCKTSSILADDGNQNESFPVMNSDAKMAVIPRKYNFIQSDFHSHIYVE